MSWKYGSGNRDQLFNRGGGGGVDPESGLAESMSVRRGNELDSEVESLRKKIGMLKQVSQDVNEELKLRNSVIAEMETTIIKVSLAIKSASKKVNKLYNQSSANHMIVLVIFVFAVFMGAYMWIRASKLAKRVGIIGDE